MELRLAPWRPIYIRIAADRFARLVATTGEIFEAKSLSGALASPLWGRLSWTCGSTHGRMGKAKLQPLCRSRKRSRSVNIQLVRALLWWRHFLGSCAPRSIAAFSGGVRHIVLIRTGRDPTMVVSVALCGKAQRLLLLLASARFPTLAGSCGDNEGPQIQRHL